MGAASDGADQGRAVAGVQAGYATAKTWRWLNGENQLPKVVQGVTFRNGVEVINTPAQNVAQSRRHPDSNIAPLINCKGKTLPSYAVNSVLDGLLRQIRLPADIGKRR
jgi:hypothetical protein